MASTPQDLGIQYIELAVGDVAAAKQFYGDTFGWSFTDYGPTYASFTNAAVDGGFNGESPEHVGRPLVILYAVDLEGMVTRVERSGGKIVKPIFSFPGGRRFHFTDPAGNELAIWSDK
jgi:predicted enzyme related to lactoylglutathione lyase